MTRSVDPSSLHLRAVDPRNLVGWHNDQGAEALSAFQKQALEIQRKGSGFSRNVLFGGRHEDWISIAVAAQQANDPKTFWRDHFQCFAVTEKGSSTGLFTGYYEPLVFGSFTKSKIYPVPLYKKPTDLVAFSQVECEQTKLQYGKRHNGLAQAYFDRRDIENGALQGRDLEICWLKSWSDAYFLHIQGSGKVCFEDGSSTRLSYAAKSGLPYTSIGKILVDRGIFTDTTISMQAIKKWMSQNPDDARHLMWQNKSYIFFRESKSYDAELGAAGAAQVPLTPCRSLAVDRDIWMFGTPFWIDTCTPFEAGNKPLQQMMIAQDTGSAIKGAIRGDIYWGWGDMAELIAGHMKSSGTLHVFLPNQVVARLGLQQ